jgi:hypothetical protein
MPYELLIVLAQCEQTPAQSLEFRDVEVQAKNASAKVAASSSSHLLRRMI